MSIQAVAVQRSAFVAIRCSAKLLTGSARVEVEGIHDSRVTFAKTIFDFPQLLQSAVVIWRGVGRPDEKLFERILLQAPPCHMEVRNNRLRGNEKPVPLPHMFLQSAMRKSTCASHTQMSVAAGALYRSNPCHGNAKQMHRNENPGVSNRDKTCFAESRRARASDVFFRGRNTDIARCQEGFLFRGRGRLSSRAVTFNALITRSTLTRQGWSLNVALGAVSGSVKPKSPNIVLSKGRVAFDGGGARLGGGGCSAKSTSPSVFGGARSVGRSCAYEKNWARTL